MTDGDGVMRAGASILKRTKTSAAWCARAGPAGVAHTASMAVTCPTAGICLLFLNTALILPPHWLSADPRRSTRVRISEAQSAVSPCREGIGAVSIVARSAGGRKIASVRVSTGEKGA